MLFIFFLHCSEFAKLRALRAFASYMSLRLRVLRALRAFVLHVPYSRALSTRLAHLFHAPCNVLFVRLKIFLGWICSPAGTFHFPRTIKITTNCAVFMWVKNSLETFKTGQFFKHI